MIARFLRKIWRWEDPVEPDDMNKIESGIEAVTDEARALRTRVDGLNWNNLPNRPDIPQASNTLPLSHGTANAGNNALFSRANHVHPEQTTITGNAGTATRLQTFRTINNTNFDGTVNITTANWGTARNVTIGNHTVTGFNGSGNLSMTLAQIGAAPVTHNHDASAINIGTLAVARGGTGHTSLQAARNAMGLGNTTGAVPVANGGTGATTAAVARTNLSITPSNIGALPTTGGQVRGNIVFASGRPQAIDIFNATTSNAVNMCVVSNGHIARSSSASKYKMLIREDEKILDEKILDLNVKSWFDKGSVERFADALTKQHNGEDVDISEMDIDPMRRFYGFIAEDVENAGLGQFVEYGADGEIEGIFYSTLWVSLLPIIREQKRKIEDQGQRIEDLENKLKQLSEIVNTILKSEVANDATID